MDQSMERFVREVDALCARAIRTAKNISDRWTPFGVGISISVQVKTVDQFAYLHSLVEEEDGWSLRVSEPGEQPWYIVSYKADWPGGNEDAVTVNFWAYGVLAGAIRILGSTSSLPEYAALK